MRALRAALLTVYDYAVVYLGVIWLGVLCLAWTPVAFLILPLLGARRGRALGRYVVMAVFRFYLASLALSRRFSFDLECLDALRDEPSLIIAPNHPSLLDAVMIISRLPNVACVLKAALMHNVFLGSGARLARYICNTPVRRMVREAIDDFASGSHLLLFPEGSRTTQPAPSLKGSVGLIALHAGVPVQTVQIESTNPAYLGKGWGLFRKPPLPIHYRLRLGQRFDPPQNTQRFMSELEQYFSRTLLPAAQTPPQPCANAASEFSPEQPVAQ